MKWLRRSLVGLIVIVCLAVGFTMLTAPGGVKPVGFTVTHATDASGQPFAIGVWYPTSARPWPTTLVGASLMKVAKNGTIAGKGLPLVVISHGNGAGMTAHMDLALALASNGYVVAAPMHSGDNFQDQSGVGSPAFFNLRSQQYLVAIDHVLKSWPGRDHLDIERVGAFGMSMGGFSVLTAIGAQPDLRSISTQCAKANEFVCEVLRHFNSPYVGAVPVAGEPFVGDARIKAAVLAAPGLGFTMTGNALDRVSVPLQLWVGDKDDKVPDAGPVRHLGGDKVELHSVAGAGHLSFLAPCSGLLRPPEICADTGGFDREAFHATMNARVVAFFDRHLKRQQGSLTSAR